MMDRYLKFIFSTILIIPVLMIVLFGISFNIKMLVSVFVENIETMEGSIKGILLVYILVPALYFWIEGIILTILYYYKHNKGIFIKNKLGGE